MTTGATLSGPSLANWFLERKLGDGKRDTLDQSDWCLMFLCCHAWISLLCLPEPRAKRKTVLKVRCFRDAFLRGSKGAFVSWCSTRERCQEGIPLRPLGLSLWKLSKRRVRLSSLLILTVVLPSLSAMADLYPSMVLGCNFLSSKRCSRKSATDFTGGDLKST